MHDAQRRDSSEVHSPSSHQELVGPIRSDLRALAEIIARVELQSDQVDCFVRVKAAIERGIELSDRLSDSWQ